MDWIIRKAEPGELGSLGRLHEQASATMRGLLPNGWGQPLLAQTPAVDSMEETLAEYWADEGSFFLVAEHQGEIVGFALGCIETNSDDLVEAPFCTLVYLTVAEEHRGQGIAAALVKAIEDEMSARGIARLDVLVWDANLPARRLYEKLGFGILELRLGKRLL